MIARFFPAEHAAYVAARQQRGEMLPVAHRLSLLHNIVFLACLVGLLGALVLPGGRRRSIDAVVPARWSWRRCWAMPSSPGRCPVRRIATRPG